jgi:hypothetical protein
MIKKRASANARVSKGNRGLGRLIIGFEGPKEKSAGRLTERIAADGASCERIEE